MSVVSYEMSKKEKSILSEVFNSILSVNTCTKQTKVADSLMEKVEENVWKISENILFNMKKESCLEVVTRVGKDTLCIGVITQLTKGRTKECKPIVATLNCKYAKVPSKDLFTDYMVALTDQIDTIRSSLEKEPLIVRLENVYSNKEFTIQKEVLYKDVWGFGYLTKQKIVVEDIKYPVWKNGPWVSSSVDVNKTKYRTLKNGLVPLKTVIKNAILEVLKEDSLTIDTESPIKLARFDTNKILIPVFDTYSPSSSNSTKTKSSKVKVTSYYAGVYINIEDGSCRYDGEDPENPDLLSEQRKISASDLQEHVNMGAEQVARRWINGDLTYKYNDDNDVWLYGTMTLDIYSNFKLKNSPSKK